MCCECVCDGCSAVCAVQRRASRSSSAAVLRCLSGSESAAQVHGCGLSRVHRRLQIHHTGDRHP